MMKNRKKHLSLFISFILTSTVYTQKDTLRCEDCDLRKRAKIIELIQLNTCKSTDTVVIYDYAMNYINGFRIQKYIHNEPIEFDLPTYSLLFKRKYYKKFYSKLKKIPNVRYVGMENDKRFKDAIEFIMYFLDQEKVKSNIELSIYRKMRDIQLLDDYEIKAEDFYWLCQEILSFSDQLNCFTEKKYVLEICDRFLKEKGGDEKNDLIDYKLIIVFKR